MKKLEKLIKENTILGEVQMPNFLHFEQMDQWFQHHFSLHVSMRVGVIEGLHRNQSGILFVEGRSYDDKSQLDQDTTYEKNFKRMKKLPAGSIALMERTQEFLIPKSDRLENDRFPQKLLLCCKATSKRCAADKSKQVERSYLDSFTDIMNDLQRPFKTLKTALHVFRPFSNFQQAKMG